MFASNCAGASACTSLSFSARDAGFILKFPPTKNFRAIVAQEVCLLEMVGVGKQNMRSMCLWGRDAGVCGAGATANSRIT